MLITIEGLPGSGKSTQRKAVANYFRQIGYQTVVESNFSNWNNESSAIVSHLATNGPGTPLEKLFFFLADGAGFISRFVRPISHHGNSPVVIAAGGPDGIIAYQGFAENIAPIKLLAQMRDLAMGDSRPDITLLLDIAPKDVELSEGKTHENPESRREYFTKVRAGYLEIATLEPNRFIVIDASGTQEDTSDKICIEIAKFYSNLRKPQNSYSKPSNFVN